MKKPVGKSLDDGIRAPKKVGGGGFVKPVYTLVAHGMVLIIGKDTPRAQIRIMNASLLAESGQDQRGK